MNGKAMAAGDWGLFVALAAIWGGAYVLIELALVSIAPLTLVLLRLAFGGVLLWGVMRAMRERLPPGRVAWTQFLVLALLNNVLPFCLYAWGQTRITGGLASILNATTPIWGVVVAHWLTHDERATPGKLLGALLGFAGVVVMIGGDALAGVMDNVLAESACLAGALAYALAAIYGRRYGVAGMAPMPLATGQTLVAVAVMVPLVLAFEPPWRAGWPDAEGWAAVAGLGVLSTALGFVLYFRLIARAGAVNAMAVTFAIPVTAILLGAVLLDETLAPRHWAGMALIAAGLAAIDGRLLRLPLSPRPPAVP